MLEVRKVNYAGHPVVKVRIQSVKPSLVVVKMEDGGRGMIRKREWNWDHLEKPNTEAWVEGTSHEAVLLSGASKYGYAQLSFKEKIDPWENAKDFLKLGDSLKGVVVNILDDAIFVQLKPGINAINWAVNLPMLPEQFPNSILSIGDQVYAQIVELDIAQRRVAVSINDWLRAMDIKPGTSKDRLSHFFRENLEALKNVSRMGLKDFVRTESEEFEVLPLKELKSVLIVDDQENDRTDLKKALSSLNISIKEAFSGDEALDWFKAGNTADLVIMDINLGANGFGPDIAGQILDIYGAHQHFLFTSKDPHNIIAFRLLEEKYQTKFPFYTKQIGADPDELIHIIRLLEGGFVYKTSGIVARNQGAFVEQLEMQAYLNTPLETGLTDMLADLQRSTFVQHAFILELEEDQRSFKVVAALPNRRLDLYEFGLDNLYFSQARDVIEDEEILYASSISKEEKQSRFHNFFNHIHFTSCYAIPIRLKGYAARHGLFVLNNSPDLTWETILHIRTMSNYCSVLIERDLMLRKLQMYEDRYFKGQLFGTLLHELSNALNGLKNYIDITHSTGLVDFDAGKLQIGVSGLKQSYTAISEMTTSYTRLMKDELEYVDINETVEKVKRQLNYKAKEENNVEIILELDKDAPRIKANKLRVEQIISNVLLNAIQHVSMQFKHIKSVNDIRGYQSPIQSDKAVLIQTCYCSNVDMCRIAIMDTGPGVHYDQHQRVFKAGVSSRRDGQGLGLFISKNLAEAMEGELILAESIRFAGSAFVVSFPVKSS
jgi:signal transduction histidine kinase/CheY-like chemotaxis protein